MPDNFIHIRQAKPADLDRITAIENQSFLSDRFSRRQFLYLISRACGMFYVAELDGMVVGYVSLLTHARTRNLRIYAIATDPDFRGRGIAQALLDKTLRYAQQHDLRTISLEVRPDNAAALKLYRKNGFTQTAVKPHYYADGAEARCLKLRIDTNG